MTTKREEIRLLRSQISKLQQEKKQSHDREKELEKIIDTQLSKVKKSYFVIPKGKFEPAVGHFRRVIIPDTHGCLIDKRAAAAFLNDLEYLKPKEVILIGDHLECGGFLAEHHTLGYVAQANYTFAEDVDATNVFLDEVQNKCGNITYEYIEGNHERRLETWCITKALRCGKDAQWLLDKIGAKASLHLEKRGINYYPQGEFFDGLRVPGTIKRGKCVFTHGSSTADDAPSKMLGKFACNLVFGHTHRVRSVTKLLVGVGDVAAYNIGHLAVPQPLWRHTDPTTWSHAYGVQIVNPDGSFLHITVSITDGHSLLGPLLNPIG